MRKKSLGISNAKNIPPWSHCHFSPAPKKHHYAWSTGFGGRRLALTAASSIRRSLSCSAGYFQENRSSSLVAFKDSIRSCHDLYCYRVLGEHQTTPRVRLDSSNNTTKSSSESPPAVLALSSQVFIREVSSLQTLKDSIFATFLLKYSTWSGGILWDWSLGCVSGCFLSADGDRPSGNFARCEPRNRASWSLDSGLGIIEGLVTLFVCLWWDLSPLLLYSLFDFISFRVFDSRCGVTSSYDHAKRNCFRPLTIFFECCILR